nr:unnamed protein product [Callosobruchus chinensis]
MQRKYKTWFKSAHVRISKRPHPATKMDSCCTKGEFYSSFVLKSVQFAFYSRTPSLDGISAGQQDR